MALTIGDTLAVLLPTADETALLAACLWSGADAGEAWARWRRRQGASDAALRHALAAARTLLPLLAASAARNQLDIGRDALAYLRAATLREELRAARYRQIAAAVLTALHEDGAAAFVVRGAALAGTVYDAWALRHCHDLDLLLRPADLATSVRALRRVDCIPTGRLAEDASAGARLRHASGLEVALHTRPFAVAYYDVPIDGFVHDGATITIDGVPARVPSREATLVHVLGHASYSPSRRNLRWVTDVWQLAARHPDLDWGAVAARIETARLALPVSVLLRYLADLGVAMPADLPATLRRCVGRPSRAAEDVALGGAHTGGRGDVRSLWRATPTWRGRLRVARWVVAPAPAYLRSAFNLRSPWLLPLCYLYRPARFAVGMIRRRPAPTTVVPAA